MTIQDVPVLRLLNQQIAHEGNRTAAEIVKHMGAMQAQDYYGSLWALGVRTGCTENDIVQAIENREIVRTWPQRGTLHFVPAEDAKWLVALSADRILKSAARRREQLGLDERTLALSKETLIKSLVGNQQLTRPQIMQLLENAGISTKAGRGYHILWYLSQTGVTYLGPMQAKQQTFGLLDELVPQPAMYSRQEAIAELAKRYFVSHGPATIQDFMWWSGLASADAKAGLDANSALLTSQEIDGKTYWMPPVTEQKDVSNAAFLLPGFDEYMLGYKDRSAAPHIDHAQKIVPGGNGMFLPTIIIRGQVVGTWKRTVKKNHVLLTLAPFKQLTQADINLLDAPAAAFGKFVGLPSHCDGELKYRISQP